MLSLDFFLCLKHCYKDFFLVALCSSTLRHDFFSCSNSRFINKFQYTNIYIWVKIPIQYLINQYFDFRMEYMNFPHFSQLSFLHFTGFSDFLGYVLILKYLGKLLSNSYYELCYPATNWKTIWEQYPLQRSTENNFLSKLLFSNLEIHQIILNSLNVSYSTLNKNKLRVALNVYQNVRLHNMMKLELCWSSGPLAC